MSIYALVTKGVFIRWTGLLISSQCTIFSFSIKPKSWFVSPASLLLKMYFFFTSPHFPSFVKDESKNTRIMPLWHPKCGSLFYFDLHMVSLSVEREEQMSATDEG